MWPSILLGTYGRLEPVGENQSSCQDGEPATVVWRPDEVLKECVSMDLAIALKQVRLRNGERVLLGNFGGSAFLNQVMTLGIGITEANGLHEFGQLNALRLNFLLYQCCLLYTSPSPRDQRGSRMPSSA